MQHTEQATIKDNIQPINSFPQFAWGESLGLIFIALTVLARKFIADQESKKGKKEKEDSELVEFLKKENEEKDRQIALLTNELILTQKTLAFSGEFAPPVTRERTKELKAIK